MGHTPSRIHDSNAISSPETPDSVSTRLTSSPSSTMRPSRLRSVRNLVTPPWSSTATLPSSRTGNRDVDTQLQPLPSSSSRRRWCSSRRLSRSPLSSSSNDIANSNPSQTMHQPQINSEPLLTVPKIGEHNVEHEQDTLSPPSSSSLSLADRPPTPFRSPPTSISTSTSPVANASDAPDGPIGGTNEAPPALSQNEPQNAEPRSGPSLAQRLGLNSIQTARAEAVEGDVAPSPSSSTASGQSEATVTPENAPASTQASPPQLVQPQGRQFPPPGTLVLVQGVVHTSDQRLAEHSNAPLTAPRTPTPLPHPQPPTPRRALSVPRSSTSSSPSSGTRNRLSALIPRPSSILGRPSTRTAGDESHNPSIPLTSNPGSSGSTAPSEQASSSSSSEIQSTSTGPVSDTSTPASDPQPLPDMGTMSPSSIEVLGTLLSVAAAATAASLLTGSSEPIFSSGLGPPTNGTGNVGAAEPPPNSGTASASANSGEPARPMSPTPTSGLGMAFAPLAMGSGVAEPEPPAQTGRMRSVWGSLRERLGLGSGSRGTNGVSNGGSSTGQPSERERDDRMRPLDPRERVFAEMARAFNMGLGLASLGGVDSSQAPTPSETNGSGLPPEDSFERFLIDLQADLRVALSAPSENLAENVTTLPPLPSSNPAPAAQEHRSELGLSDSSMTTEENGGDGLPPVTDGLNGEDEHAYETENVESGSDPVVTGDGAQPTRPPSGGERRTGNGINWWRMYRFPLINTPQAQGHPLGTDPGEVRDESIRTPGATHSDQNSASTSHNTSSAPFINTTSRPISSATQTEPPPQLPQANVVVPVILVGLQSVSIIPRQQWEPSQSFNEDNGPSPSMDGIPGVGDLPPELQQPGEFENATGESPRGRTWGSRAANAFRNMRPGRRTNERGNIPLGIMNGSRTFMIYVIGGYYPPDHHLVTGSTNLDSFEAFWELAELLGQVKPPTVSREEIEKSGLEIIRPSQIKQYEGEGKVATSCVDRCLICLDDYEDTDDVRVMHCRHAFHKRCVDRWLQTGRNNCPACRSKGVSTDETPVVPSPMAEIL